MKAVSFMLSVDWIAMMSVELLIKSNSLTMCLEAFVGLWMCLVLGDEAELTSLFLHNTIALHEFSMYMRMCLG